MPPYIGRANVATGGGPKLYGRARIKFKRVHIGVSSMSRFVPPALSSNLA